jgi:hypothetical protein
LAGLAPGATSTGTADYRPKNAVNGFVGVTNAAKSPVTGIKGTYIVCSDAIPGKIAKQLDTILDDGNTATGSVMVVAASTPTSAPTAPLATSALVDDAIYLVCMGY